MITIIIVSAGPGPDHNRASVLILLRLPGHQFDAVQAACTMESLFSWRRRRRRPISGAHEKMRHEANEPNIAAVDTFPNCSVQ